MLAMNGLESDIGASVQLRHILATLLVRGAPGANGEEDDDHDDDDGDTSGDAGDFGGVVGRGELGVWLGRDLIGQSTLGIGDNVHWH